MLIARFIVQAVPVAQPRHRVSTQSGFVKHYLPSKHKVHDFKASVRADFIRAMGGGLPPLTGPIGLTILFVLPRPGYLMWKKKPMPRCRHDAKPDLDNLEKGLKDALSKLAWKDDCQVCEVVKDKVYASGYETPHVAVEIYDLSEVPFGG